jgi:hypothetical protein
MEKKRYRGFDVDDKKSDNRLSEVAERSKPMDEYIQAVPRESFDISGRNEDNKLKDIDQQTDEYGINRRS